MSFNKEESVRIKTLNKALIPFYIDRLDRCHRGKNKTGTIYHPAYETFNHFWYVKHDDGTVAFYHESEIERYERPKPEKLSSELPQSESYYEDRPKLYNPLED